MDLSPDQINAVLALGTGLAVLIAVIWALTSNGRSKRERQAINGMMVRVPDNGPSNSEPSGKHAPPPTTPDTGN